MRMSQLFGQTLRKPPADAQVASHQLLVQAGFIRQLGAGIFSYLHLAQRSMTKIENILRDEMDHIGGQEITMPVVHPADLWKETGRWYQIGSEMGRFRDKNERDMVLAMTHEEVIAVLVRTEIQSYKQLPRLLYHIQTKWRDDPRPRAGLIRVREFTMKDSYSLDADWEGLDTQYRAHYQAYFDIFHRCGLPVVAVKSDVGMMGGKLAHEFMYLAPIGEDTLIICDTCGYMANRQIARFQKHASKEEKPRQIEKVTTPGVTTIQDLARFLEIPESRTAKAFFRMATITEGQQDTEKLVFAVVRGDMDVNETKLANALNARALRPATGIKNVITIVDDLIPGSSNLVAGANEEGYHLLNVNYGRDYQADVVKDIAAAEDGYACPDCGEAMRASKGVEVGNIFKLGTRYSEAMGCTFLDKHGHAKPIIMGSYGIGVGRLLACVAEEHRDEYGLIWPISVAPYQVHLVALQGGEEAADCLYADLQSAGVEVLYDDREERAGVKFNDADLMGMPIRLTVGKRSLAAGGIELKLRRDPERTIVPSEQILSQAVRKIGDLQAEIIDRVVAVPYNA
jgi:prolyl-tRNA synthetase